MKIKVAAGDTITAVLAAAQTTADPKVLVRTSDFYGDSTQWVSLNGVTPVTLFTGYNPNAFLEGISLTNTDTGAITITLKHVVGGTSYTFAKFTLQVSDTLLIDEEGIRVLDVSGQRKQANAATVQTTLTGPINGIIGASTAAAGTTYADAGALPAGTGNIYPTTAADGTKGVILSTSEKVDGRTIYIGNGVSNAILKVYAPAGGTINGASANTAFSSASGKGVTIICLSAASNTWLAF